jgi:transcriptional regulator with XRE-family HTH domain
MAGILSRDESRNLIENYIAELCKGHTLTEICGATGLYRVAGEKSTMGAYYPSEEQISLFISAFDDNDFTRLREMAKNSPEITLRYWNLINPEAENSDRLGLVLKDYILENGFNKREILQKSGLAESSFSAILNARTRLTPSSLIKIADAMDVPIMEVLENMKKTKGKEEREEFTNLIREERLKQGFTQQEVAMKCETSTAKYQKIEKGLITIPKKTLELLVRTLGLNYEYCLDLIIKGRMCNKELYLSENVKNPFGEGYNVIRAYRQPQSRDKKLVNLINSILQYDFIKYNDNYLSTNAVLTIVATSILDSKTFCHLGEIMYMISNLKFGVKQENLGRQLVSDKGLSDDAGYTEIFEHFRAKQSVTYDEASRVVGITKGNLFTSMRNGGLKNLNTMYEIHTLLGIPVVYGVENWLHNQKENVTLEENELKGYEDFEASRSGEPCTVVDMEDIFVVLERTLVWAFCGARIPSEELYNLFDIPFRRMKGTTVYDRAKSITELKIVPPVRDAGIMRL